MKPVHFCTGFIFCSFPVVDCTPLKMSVKIQVNVLNFVILCLHLETDCGAHCTCM